MKAFTKVDEANDVSQNSSMWKNVVYTYPNEKRLEFMYRLVCIVFTRNS